MLSIVPRVGERMNQQDQDIAPAKWRDDRRLNGPPFRPGSCAAWWTRPLVSVVPSVVPVVILMIPVPFMKLPALPVVIIVGMAPIGPFKGRTVPAPCHPPIVMPMRGPVPADPGVARTWKRPTLLVTKWRWCGSDVYRNLCRSRNAESGCEQYAAYPIQSHLVTPVEYCVMKHGKISPHPGFRLRNPSGG